MTRLLLKLTITASDTQSRKSDSLGIVNWIRDLCVLKHDHEPIFPERLKANTQRQNVLLGNWQGSYTLTIQNHRRGVGWRSRAYKLLNSFVRKKQSQRNNPFLFPAGNMPQQLFMIRYLRWMTKDSLCTRFPPMTPPPHTDVNEPLLLTIPRIQTLPKTIDVDRITVRHLLVR